MARSLLVYLGLIICVIGLLSLVMPLRLLQIKNRARAGIVMVGGFGIILVGFLLPAREIHIEHPHTHLDEFAPVYQFHEFHSTRINAPPERVYAAIRAVSADEISFFHTLTWIRRGGRRTPEGILNPSQQTPVLEVAVRSGFLLLAEEPNREIVIGSAVLVPTGWRPAKKPTPDDFKSAHAPGFALASMNFLVQSDGPNASLVTTETRIFATDPASVRKFARYWSIVYPGSALIRRMWLLAIKSRAEAAE